MADDVKVQKQQFLSDFEKDGQTHSETRKQKCDFIREYGEDEWNKLVTRSIRKGNAEKNRKQ